jgi:ubiquinone/menaquinone biosynthesis C-methylase UbiE
VPSLDWNRRWGPDLARQLEKQRLRYYGEQWGDPGAPRWRRLLGSLVGKGRFRNLPRVVRDYVEPSVCLEIGPGGGRWTRFLLGARELVLVDLNAEFFDYLRERFPEAVPRMRFYQTRGYELAGVDDASIDFAFSFGTFVHIEPEGIDAYLGELRRVLRPGAVAVLQYADKSKPRGRENADFSDMDPARMEALAAKHALHVRAHDTTLLLHSSIAVLER